MNRLKMKCSHLGYLIYLNICFINVKSCSRSIQQVQKYMLLLLKLFPVIKEHQTITICFVPGPSCMFFFIKETIKEAQP